MKNKSLIIISVVLVAVIAAAVFLYPRLSQGYTARQEKEQSGISVDVNGAGGTADKADSGNITNEIDAGGANGIGQTNEAPKTADFTVYDMDGNEVRLSDFFGKPIVVNFWATWCGPCRSELPAFDEAYREHKDDVTFLMVNLTDGRRDTRSGVKEFIAGGNYSFPVYLDKDYDASFAYGVYSIPETLFINADGTLFDTRIGEMSRSELNSYIEILIGGAK